MSTSTSARRSPSTFFVVVFTLSIPLSLAGTVIGLELLPGLPLSALVVAFCPMITALILVYRENKTAGVTDLLKRAFDYKRIKAKVWYAPIIFLMPGVMTLEYGLLRLMGSPIPTPQFSILAALGLFLAFFVAALGEELGWMGYAIDPLQERTSALRASVLLGVVGAIWHFIPLMQAQRSLEWIAWWSLFTVASRVLSVWLYNNTGKSVFGVAVFHAMSNVTWQLFPINGSYYDPRLTGLIVAVAAVIVIFLWGPRTLDRYRKAQSMPKLSVKQTEDAAKTGSIFKQWFYRNKQWLYRGRRPNRYAKILNRAYAIVAAKSALVSGLVALEVIGRKSGRIISFPLVMVDMDGQRYLASMLGDNTQWVRNVRAANGKAVLRCDDRREEVQLGEVPVDQRAPILKAYLQAAPGARPHVPVDKDAPLAEFEKIAAAFPVFRLVSAQTK